MDQLWIYVIIGVLILISSSIGIAVWYTKTQNKETFKPQDIIDFYKGDFQKMFKDFDKHKITDNDLRDVKKYSEIAKKLGIQQ